MSERERAYQTATKSRRRTRRPRPGGGVATFSQPDHRPLRHRRRCAPSTRSHSNSGTRADRTDRRPTPVVEVPDATAAVPERALLSTTSRAFLLAASRVEPRPDRTVRSWTSRRLGTSRCGALGPGGSARRSPGSSTSYVAVRRRSESRAAYREPGMISVASLSPIPSGAASASRSVGRCGCSPPPGQRAPD